MTATLQDMEANSGVRGIPLPFFMHKYTNDDEENRAEYTYRFYMGETFVFGVWEYHGCGPNSETRYVGWNGHGDGGTTEYTQPFYSVGAAAAEAFRLSIKNAVPDAAVRMAGAINDVLAADEARAYYDNREWESV
jgi:hypothetical protein